MADLTLRKALTKQFPHLKISTEMADLLNYSRDTWALMQIRTHSLRVDNPPDLIVWPKNTKEVAEVFQFASQREVSVTPIGGGSGVCGGAVPDEGAIVMDLKYLDQYLEIDQRNRIAQAGAGWIGSQLEDELNRHGVTAGHFPSSIMCSTLGGWFAARGAGQLSTFYGKFEDRVRNVEWVYPDGTIEMVNGEGCDEGVLELLCGSEGTLGVATKVGFRVDPLPPARAFRAYTFSGVENALQTIRELLQQGVMPAVVRLYDPLDTLLKKSMKQKNKGKKSGRFDHQLRILKHAGQNMLLRNPKYFQQIGERIAKQSLLVMVFEGTPELVDYQVKQTEHMMKSRAKSAGEEPAQHWYQHRYDVSFKQSAIFQDGGFVDTMEVAFPWSHVYKGYQTIRHVLGGDVLVFAHFSHFYVEGASIYFTLSGFKENSIANEQLYREMWRRGLDAAIRCGGTITHHHGVGLLKAAWMPTEWGAGYQFLRNVKAQVDHAHIANPGKLGL